MGTDVASRVKSTQRTSVLQSLETKLTLSRRTFYMNGRQRLALLFMSLDSEISATVFPNFLDQKNAWAISQEIPTLATVSKEARIAVVTEFENLYKKYPNALAQNLRRLWLSDDSLELNHEELQACNVQSLVTLLVKLPPEASANIFNALTSEAVTEMGTVLGKGQS